MLRYLPFLLVLALWIYAFIDCLNTPEKEVRHLPKVVWVIIVLLFGEVLIGPVAWLVAGKKRAGSTAGRGAGGSGATRWVAPDDNPEFLSGLGKDRAKSADAEQSTQNEPAQDEQARKDEQAESRMKDWEADLRRREEELRGRESGSAPGPSSGTVGPTAPTAPAGPASNEAEDVPAQDPGARRENLENGERRSRTEDDA